MIQVLVLGLHFPEVHANRSDWTNQFDCEGVLVTLLTCTCELNRVNGQHNTTQGHDSWYKINFSIVVFGYEEVTDTTPNCKIDELVSNDSSVNKWIIFDTLRSPYRPSQQWVANHEVNKQGGQVPQP